MDGPDICRTLITNQGSMDKNFEVFDFHRIFVGDAPLTFLLEIVVCQSECKINKP